MWIRKCELDDAAPEQLPVPAQFVSNEEFVPPPQSTEQKQYEARCLELAEQGAKKQGLDRRRFLRTGSGMAAALLALACMETATGKKPSAFFDVAALQSSALTHPAEAGTPEIIGGLITPAETFGWNVLAKALDVYNNAKKPPADTELEKARGRGREAVQNVSHARVILRVAKLTP